jgi:hemoglobin
MKKLMIPAFVLMMAGCMQAPQTDLEGLKAMIDVSQSAFDTRDPAAIAAIYADDGAVMSPNSATTTGQAAIEGYWSEVLASGIDLGVARATDLYALGDVGYEVGTYAVTDASGDIDEGKYIRIWRHGDGKWQLQHVTWNSDIPLSAPEPESENNQKTLYQRLGGYDVVAAIFDNLGSRIAGDPELTIFLTGIDEEMGKRGREIALDQLCDLTGGPCVYTGRDVKMVHKGLGITDEHWQLVLEYTGQTLDELNIGDDEKTDFIAIIAGLGGT